MGFQVSIAMGLASFPLCFDLYTTLWFNNLAVTTDVPPPDVRDASAHHSSVWPLSSRCTLDNPWFATLGAHTAGVGRRTWRHTLK
eukprot:COSAG02_NODE_5902_length_3942_cov_10.008314_2_plen_85_part_00